MDSPETVHDLAEPRTAGQAILESGSHWERRAQHVLEPSLDLGLLLVVHVCDLAFPYYEVFVRNTDVFRSLPR